ncbi:hypothetical protein EH165_08615 [Nakamurella antarctica]|uniref:beta-N-acetylhexosaminidase n=1 Tax=Nakamurella antarctica TaxID=1902245 RepID=A0A3G8ZLU0_9ACTN|nr:glycoside hydrolase family 3 N-terminal domain-containing protein [Nakamurella antarctica]AZI58190.1 hypothetical protein EH165_08615 [Nakamurella antarctica]
MTLFTRFRQALVAVSLAALAACGQTVPPDTVTATAALPSLTASAPPRASAPPILTTPSSPQTPEQPAESSSSDSSSSQTGSSQTGAEPPAPSAASGVRPWGVVTQADIDLAASAVAAMAPDQKAGAVIMASSADVVGKNTVADLGLGGVIMMGSKGIVDGTDSGSPAEVASVIDAAASQVADPAFPLLVGIDQEYGDVTRLRYGFTKLPGASELGAIRDLPVAARVTEQVAAIAGAEMAAVGVNIDFAPVSDVLPQSGSSSIGDRSYGRDPARVAALVVAAVRGFQSAGVAATLKHFPGIGELAADTHDTLPTVEATCAQWNAEASVPIRAGIDAGVSLVMTGHTRFPAIGVNGEPTSISPIALTDLLRGNTSTQTLGGCEPLNFTGLTISDSLQMVPISGTYSPGDAAWRALAAGEDMLLMPSDPRAAVAGIVAAVADGSLASSRLDEAAIRVLALRSALHRTPRPSMDVIDSVGHNKVAQAAWDTIG